jgi:hypothetical protein
VGLTARIRGHAPRLIGSVLELTYPPAQRFGKQEEPDARERDVLFAVACGTDSEKKTEPTNTIPPSTTAPRTLPPFTTAPRTFPPFTAPQTTSPPPGRNCNPNYTPCVPNDPIDVDCEGGGGDGPSYVRGPVRVTGQDVYDLDRGGQPGIGCET